MTSQDAEFPAPGPIDLGQSLRLGHLWGSDTNFTVDATGAWYAGFTPEGPATVQLVLNNAVLRARAWGPGALVALERVPDLAGLKDPGVSNIRAEHPLVRALIRTHPGYRQIRTHQLYSRLLNTAIHQKVTSRNGRRCYVGLVRTLGNQAPGPRDDLWLPPTPEVLSQVPYYALHSLNLERHRADLIRRIAQHAERLELALRLSVSEASDLLQSMTGIGPWTSAVVLASAMGDADAVPYGDYHLKNYVSWNLSGEPRGTDEHMEALLAPYLGDRGRVVRMLKSSGRTPPRYGPKSAVRDIRRQ